MSTSETKDRVEIAPGSPQWIAWKNYRIENNLTTALMDRCAERGDAWVEYSEWPPSIDASASGEQDAETETYARPPIDPETPLGPCANLLGFEGTFGAPRLRLGSPGARAGIAAHDAMVRVFAEIARGSTADWSLDWDQFAVVGGSITGLIFVEFERFGELMRCEVPVPQGMTRNRSTATEYAVPHAFDRRSDQDRLIEAAVSMGGDGWTPEYARSYLRDLSEVELGGFLREVEIRRSEDEARGQNRLRALMEREARFDVFAEGWRRR
jgi:hypothetical protein